MNETNDAAGAEAAAEVARAAKAAREAEALRVQTAAQVVIDAARAKRDARRAEAAAALEAAATRPDGPMGLTPIGAGTKPDPSLPIVRPVRLALGSALRDALKATDQRAAWDAALATLSEDTRAYWETGYREFLPINSPKLVRIAAACEPPVHLEELFTTAGAPTV